MKELYDLYYDELVYFGMKFIEDRQAVEDIVIDAFIRIHEHGYEDGRYALYTIVKNACINHHRNENNRNRIIGREYTEEFVECAIVDTMLVSRLMIAINKLSSDSKQVITMFYFQGKSCAEIGREINKPLDTVRSMKRFAIKRLIKLI